MIFIDMDQVLADFEAGRLQTVKDEKPEWAIDPQALDEFYGRKVYQRIHGEEAAAFAESITIRPGFFENLPPIPGSLEGFKTLAALYPVRVLSSPLRRHPHCAEEKRIWLEKHLGATVASEAIIDSNKHLFKGQFLIDDRPSIKVKEPSAEWEHVLFGSGYAHQSQGHVYTLQAWNQLENLLEFLLIHYRIG